MAKALYYWACIYVEHRVLISYETFLKIADYYNEKNTSEIRDLFSLWNADDDILDRLKLYVNKSENGQIQFNHDILAEAISNINIDGWKKFGTKIKLDLLNVITKKGDEYSISMFLESLLFKEPEIFTTYKERISFIKILIEKSNKIQHYLFELSHIDLDDSDLEEIAQLIWSKKIDSVLFWSKYFLQIDNENIISRSLPQILNKKSLAVYNPDFIGLVLKYTEDTKVKNDFINSILTDESKNDFPHRIVYDCLKYGNGEDVECFFSKILNEKDWKKIDSNILKLCLKSVSLDKKREFSDTILKYTDYHFNDISFLRLCLSYSSKEAKQVYYKNSAQPDCINDRYSLYKTYFDYAPIPIKRALSDKVLQNYNIWHKANDQIIEDSIQYASEEIRIEFLLQFLKSDVDIDIIFSKSCIKYLEDPKYISQEQQEVIKQYIFDKVLYRSYWAYTITLDFVINYFNKYANDSIKQKLYKRILKGKKWKEIEQDTLGELLKNATNTIKQNFCKKIINDNELTRIYDPTLLSFFDYEIKKDAYMKFCKDSLWINFDEDSVVEGLMIFDYPSENLYFLCFMILLNWEKEIHRSNGNPFIKISRRNHIIIALGHPDLRVDAKDVALRILQKLKNNKIFEATEEFKRIVTQIVENGIYPEWKI